MSGRSRRRLAGPAIMCAGLVAAATGGADLAYGRSRDDAPG